MSPSNKFKTNSYCVGGRHYSGTINIRGVVSAKGTKMLRGNCVNCTRNKTKTIVSVKTLYLSICEAGSWIKNNTYIIITKNIVITKH